MRSTGHEQQDYYTSIDGNPLKNPTAYCTHYHGYLSERLIKVHRCRKKHGGACARLQNMKGENIRRMNQTQFFDRLIDRMDKMIVAMNKLSKTLEAMQKANEMTPLDKALKEAQSMAAEEYLFGKMHKYAEDEDE